MEYKFKFFSEEPYFMIGYIIYLLTATGFPTGGSSTVHIYTQTIHITTQKKKYIEQHKNFGNTKIMQVTQADKPARMATSNLLRFLSLTL